jgi:hypothetical protein
MAKSRKKKESTSTAAARPARAATPAPASTGSATAAASDGRLVLGAITDSACAKLPGYAVRAAHVDLRMRTAIGSNLTDAEGRYQIAYDPVALSLPSPLHVQVEVLSPAGDVLATSAVRFNAGPREVIDLQVDANGKLSEYEKISAPLRLVMAALADPSLTQDDVPFLLNRVAALVPPPVALPAVTEERVRLWVDSEALATATRLPASFFYGIARAGELKAPLTLASFTALKDTRLRSALQTAGDKGVIALLPFEEVELRWNAARLGVRALSEQRLICRVVDDATSAPLEKVQARVTQASTQRELGTLLTDADGIFLVAYLAPPDTTERFQIELTALLGPKLTTTTVETKASPSIIEIRVPLAADADSLPSITELTSKLGITLPSGVPGYLREKGIDTLTDLRSAGGFGNLAGLPASPNEPALRRLDAHASLSVLGGYEADKVNRVVDAGFASPAEIARADRAKFVKTVKPILNSQPAATLLARAQVSEALLRNMRAGLRADRFPSNAVDGQPDELSELRNELAAAEADSTCSCNDCDAVASPAAYLADLLDYSKTYVLNGSNAVDATALESLLFQPFTALNVSCHDSYEAVSQVRMCVEVLRPYLASRSLPAAGSDAETRLQRDSVTYLERVYEALLRRLGTSLQDLRRAVINDEPISDLDLPEDAALEDLVLDIGVPDIAHSEREIERVFGLADTRRDPFSGGPTLDDAQNQIVRWTLEGVSWRRNTDESGTIHLAISQPSAGVHRVEAFRDAARTELVATGDADAEGSVVLVPATVADVEPNSGLRGVIQLELQGPATGIRLVAIPLLLSLKLARLHERWASFDAVGPTPRVDPDLVTLAELRTPLEENPAFFLWQRRHDQLEERRAELREFDATATDGARFDALLAEVGVALGSDALTAAENARLQDVKGAIDATPALPVLEADWDDVVAILVQLEKRRLTPAWRGEEVTAEISLTPDLFQLPADLSTRLRALPEFRADTASYRSFLQTLRSRIEERDRLLATHAAIIRDVEAETLAQLRDALIEASDADTTDHATKADWITEHLVINGRMDASVTNSRIGQAIETLQTFLWSVRTGLQNDTHPDIELHSANFDEEWKWLGSYASWRAAMMVFLYPENVLDPALRRTQTPGFAERVQALRDKTRLTPLDACQEAQKFAEYINDVAALRIEATCHARAPVPGKGCPDHATVGTALYTFLFARSDRTGNVYMSTYRPGVSTGYNQSPWQPVPDLAGVATLVGATVYEMSPDQRYIYVFVKKTDGSRDQLLYLRWNLEAQACEAGGAHALDMPEGVRRFNVVVQQSNDPSRPPAMLLLYNDRIFINMMTREGNAIDPAVQAALGGFFFHNGNWKPLRAVAMIALDPFPGRQYRLPQHFIVVGENGTQIYYHYFYPALEDNLDTTYGTTPISLLGNGTWKGSIHWPAPGTNLIYTFWQQAGALKYKVIFTVGKFAQAVPADPNQSLGDLPSLAGLDRIAVDSSAGLRKSNNREIAFQLGGPTRGPFLGFFSRNLGRDLGDIFDDITGGVLEEFTMERMARVAFRIKVGAGTTTSTDGGVLLAPVGTGGGGGGGGGFPPPEDPEPPEHLPLFDLNRVRLAPLLRQPVTIVQRLTDAQLQLRRATTTAAYQDNTEGPRSNLEYLDEAFFFFPVLIGLQLQRRGHYLDALDWFRTVFDFTQPPALRKIHAGLVQEESLHWSYDRNITWLLEPLNPHAIAITRRNTYTRYTLQCLVQCLLEFGDSEFSRDTSESVARAHVLYTTALGLLESDDLNPEPSACDDVIEALGDETRDDVTSGPPHVQDVYGGILDSLSDVRASIADFSAMATDVRLALKSDAPLISRLTQASRIVQKAKYARPDRATVGSVLEESAGNEEKVRAILLRRPRVVQSLEEASLVATADSDHTLTSLTGQPKDVARKLDLPWLETKVKTVELVSPLVHDDRVGHFAVLNRAGASNPLAVFTANQQMKPVFFITPRDSFCVPPNPSVAALRTQIKLALAKIRGGRNIGGFERTLDLVGAGAQALTVDGRGNAIAPETLTAPPAVFRYRTLIERAKQLVSLAQQLEATFLSILEKRDAEYYNLLKARQDLNLSLAGVRLQQLGMAEARDSVRFAELQLERAQLQSTYYSGLLGDVDSTTEKLGLLAMGAAGTVAGIYSSSPGTAIQGVTTLAGVLTGSSNADRKKELKQALTMARQDEEISTQGIRLAHDRLQIRAQELNIASLQSSNAQQTLDFLVNKFTNAELYDWMSVVIEGVYRNFLQQATAAAQLAANQLAFERQEPVPRFIQSDYWEALVGLRAALDESEAQDRRGLTGSARLLQDVFQLDQYGFDTEQRKHQLTKTISLARVSPAEFQRFRQTGELHFVTLMSNFDGDFPGHFLRLIKRVQVTVVALIPPTEGIKATLATSGLSRVVARRDGGFIETLIRRQPERVSLCSPLNASGEFEITLRQDNDVLRPFEGSGVASDWTFTLPKPANHFEYDTIADVLLTIDYTALSSDDYRNDVIARLGSEVSSQRAFTFRYELADVWFDLNNPDQTATPMTVHFDTRRADFQANAAGLEIQDVALFFSLAEGETFEVTVNGLTFKPTGVTAGVGGSGTSSDGVISIRRGNAGSWLPMLGLSPVGTWTLALPDTPDLRAHFTAGRIQDVVFALTVTGTTAPWPV